MRSGRSTRRVPLRLPEQSERAGWLRSIRLSGFTLASITVLVLAIAVLAPSIRVFVEQRQQIAALHAELDRQQDEVEELTAERARWDDPRYIEAQARQRLNYVYPGEISYLVIDDGQTVTTDDGQPISAEVQDTRLDWVALMLSSLLTAGLTDKAADELSGPKLGGGP